MTFVGRVIKMSQVSSPISHFEPVTSSKTGSNTAFYFNFRGSFYGELACPVDVPCVIRYRQFLVTPLLPCGELDGKIQKFTGNADLGPASDAMTKAIHAFAHFSLLYSHGFLLFCDLQGLHKVSVRVLLTADQVFFNRQEGFEWRYVSY